MPATLTSAATNRPKPGPTRPAELGLSAGLRRYLYATAATTGAAIMVVEILGAKMLSPYVGTSHFVWTAQIAVTLSALACGYYAGGRLADRTQRLSGLYWAILAAAVYMVLTVLICEPVAYWCLDFNLAVGSLLASAILFFPPLALLAMTGPFLVRVLTSSVLNVGGNVGRLTSVSTLGSLVGTILIGYVLIPLLPNTETMYFTALALMLVCMGYLAMHRRAPKVPLILVLALGGGAGLLLRHSLTHEYRAMVERQCRNSNFGLMQVLDRREDGRRFYLNDGLVQNIYDPQRKLSATLFTYVLAGLARAYTTNITDLLCIGLGAGIVPMDFAAQGVHVDVVEINPAVVPLATRFFDARPERFHLILGDGRQFLNRCQQRYDVVVLDVFLGDSSPSHLLTREAFSAMKRVLRPGGTLVINTFGRLDEEHDFMSASVYQTLKAVFQSVQAHSNGKGAVFFAASERPALAFVHPPSLEGAHPSIRADLQATYDRVLAFKFEHGRVLTDNYNPVEYYDARNREEYRRRLALELSRL